MDKFSHRCANDAGMDRKNLNAILGSAATACALNRWSGAQELCNDRNLRRVHKRRRVADFWKFDQFRARPAPGHFLRNRRR